MWKAHMFYVFLILLAKHFNLYKNKNTSLIKIIASVLNRTIKNKNSVD